MYQSGHHAFAGALGTADQHSPDFGIDDIGQIGGLEYFLTDDRRKKIWSLLKIHRGPVSVSPDLFFYYLYTDVNNN